MTRLRPLKLGLVPAPELPLELAEDVAERLPEVLAAGDPASCEVTVADGEPLADRHDVGELLARAGEIGSHERWAAAICLTDLPLRSGRRPLVAAADRARRAAVIAVPAFGATRLRPRVLEATATLAVELVHGAADGRPETPLARRRIGDAFSPIRRTGPDGSARTEYVMPATVGHLRLLTGMVRANRPWRALSGLSRALVAAFATGAYALLTTTIWQLSDALGVLRLLAVTVASLAALVAWILIAHGLWESSHDDVHANDAALYNAATVATLAIAALCAYAALFVLLLAVAALMIDGSVLEKNAGASADLGGYARLAWIAASMATVAGALGSGLEDVDEVRHAAYGYNQRRRQAQCDDE